MDSTEFNINMEVKSINQWLKSKVQWSKIVIS